MARSALLKNRVPRLRPVHVFDERSQVNVCLFPIGWAGVRYVQALAETKLEADGNHHARREQRAEQIIPLERVHVAMQLLGQSRRVVAFGKTDGAGRLAGEVVLLDQPGAGKIPPLGAVEDVFESGFGGLRGLGWRAAERLGEEHDVGMSAFRFADEPPPEFFRHLIRRVAAKALDAEVRQKLPRPRRGFGRIQEPANHRAEHAITKRQPKAHHR